MLFSCVIFSFFFVKKKWEEKRMGKKWENFQKFSFSFKKEKKAKKKRPLLFSPLSEYTPLARSLARSLTTTRF